MRKLMFLMLAFFPATQAWSQLRVNNIPTGAAVVVTQPSAVFVTWTVEANTGAPVTAVSEEGLFVLGNETLGRVTTLLTASVPSAGPGIATETLLIPPDVSNRAFKRNAPTFFYQRTFRSTSDGSSGQSVLTCRLSTSAYGNFSIGAITLFFKNQRGEATFDQDDPSARASAEVHYNGTGLLKATWEVQEPGSSQFRVLEQVSYHITYGDRIVFESPSLPPLPTVVTGRHTVRFRIVEPVSGFDLPEATYFVKATAAEEKKSDKLILTAPAPDIEIDKETVFRWSGGVQGTFVQFAVSEKGSIDSILRASRSVEPVPESNSNSLSSKLLEQELINGVGVFSAALLPTAVDYKLKPEQLQRLRPGVWYVWQVQVFDSSGKVISESKLRAFKLKH